LFSLYLATTNGDHPTSRSSKQYHLKTAFGYLGAFLYEQAQSAFHSDDSTWVLLSGYLINLHDVVEAVAEAQHRQPPSNSPSAPALLCWIYRNGGLQGLRLLEGGFSLCLVDLGNGGILVLRDRLGGRSAYVHIGVNAVRVASHAHLIAEQSGVSLDEHPDYLAIRVAYAGLPPPGLTPFRSVEELLPGELRHIQSGEVHSSRQCLEISDRFQQLSLEEAVNGLRSRLTSSIRSQIIGMKSVATMLSGGLDSAPASALIAPELAKRGGTFKAISWSLPKAGPADETRRIQDTSQMLGIELELYDGLDFVPFSNLEPNSAHPGSIEFNAFRPLLDNAMQLALKGHCEGIFNFTAGDFLYPAPTHVLTGLLAGREWLHAGQLVVHVLTTWKHGTRPWLSPALRGYIRGLRNAGAIAKPYPYRLGFLTEFAKESLPPLPNPFTEAESHPVPAYARFLQTALAYQRAQESYFAERLGLRYLDPYQSEELARYFLALPFSFSYRGQDNKWIMRQMARDMIPDSIRTTPRSGNLLGFLKFGYRKNHERILQLVRSEQPHWSRVLRQERIEALLAQPRPKEAALVLISQLIGYCLWCRHWK
jgi:hypothetical protein